MRVCLVLAIDFNVVYCQPNNRLSSTAILHRSNDKSFPMSFFSISLPFRLSQCVYLLLLLLFFCLLQKKLRLFFCCRVLAFCVHPTKIKSTQKPCQLTGWGGETADFIFLLFVIGRCWAEQKKRWLNKQLDHLAVCTRFCVCREAVRASDKVESWQNRFLPALFDSFARRDANK